MSHLLLKYLRAIKLNTNRISNQIVDCSQEIRELNLKLVLRVLQKLYIIMVREDQLAKKV
jgi:hypothetical protein